MHEPSSIEPGILPAETLSPELPVSETDVVPEPVFYTGDLVKVSRPTVHCRAWMSMAAPVRITLRRGAYAVLLSDPVRSCGRIWVKVRHRKSSVEGYLATQYLELVERRGQPTLLEPQTPELDEHESASRPGDLFITSTRVNLRTGPGRRNPLAGTIEPHLLGLVLSDPVQVDDISWIQAQFRHASGWIASQFTRRVSRGQRWIEVDLESQTLVAWDDTNPVYAAPVSTGKPGFGTPTGVFTISTRYPARQLIARVNDEFWDIPGVPWVMVFREGGFYIHGVYWHDDFGTPVSHGCVTLAVADAEWLYEWAQTGTRIWIHP
ncbi:MAG: L,D-transpeptidase [Thermomicrobiales bacterium]|nr:L,D-transpeptidase [Thermomicrobiales bacterium]